MTDALNSGDSGSSQAELSDLRAQLAELTRRVYALESAGAQPKPAVALPLVATVPPPPPPAQPQDVLFQPPVPSPAAPRPKSPADSAELERKIGSHWLNRIGIVAMLIGISYFLKYAFDNHWIGPGGRVAMGLIGGTGAVVWSEWFRRRGYDIFSYSLKAVGVGTLYLSLWAAYHVYHLVPAGVAFAAMCAVTAATAALALQQDSELIAAFALAGGFATPMLLSTGENHEITLFTYVAVLDLASLLMVARRPWSRLLAGCFAATLLMGVGWYGEYYAESALLLTLGFATLFFLIFSLSPWIRGGAEDGMRYLPTLGLLNALIFLGVLWQLLEPYHHDAVGWSAVALAGFYIALNHVARLRLGSMPTLNLMHLGLALAFLTLAIPLEAGAHWITFGWLAEAMVLLWAGRRAQSDVINVFALAALALAVLRLATEDNFDASTPLFNVRLLMHLLTIAAVCAVGHFAAQRRDEHAQRLVRICTVLPHVLALRALGLELHDWLFRDIEKAFNPQTPIPFDAYDSVRRVESFSYSALGMAYGAALMALGFWRRSSFVRWMALVLLALTVAKVFLNDVWELSTGYRVLSFLVLGGLLLAVSFAYQRDWLKLSQRRDTPQQ